MWNNKTSTTTIQLRWNRNIFILARTAKFGLEFLTKWKISFGVYWNIKLVYRKEKVKMTSWVEFHWLNRFVVSFEKLWWDLRSCGEFLWWMKFTFELLTIYSLLLNKANSSIKFKYFTTKLMLCGEFLNNTESHHLKFSTVFTPTCTWISETKHFHCI